MFLVKSLETNEATSCNHTGSNKSLVVPLRISYWGVITVRRKDFNGVGEAGGLSLLWFLGNQSTENFLCGVGPAD